MPDKQIVFADRLVNLKVHNGLVRMDFGTVAGTTKTKDGKDAVRMDLTTQIVLPLDGFVAALGSQQKFFGQLQEIGKRRVAGAKADAAPASTEETPTA